MILGEDERRGEGVVVPTVNFLEQALEDSGYRLSFNGVNTKVFYMSPEMYLEILKKPTLWERIVWRALDIRDFVLRR